MENYSLLPIFYSLINKCMREKIDALTQNLALTIVGKSETIRLVLVALLAGGHALLEDVPGVL